MKLLPALFKSTSHSRTWKTTNVGKVFHGLSKFWMEGVGMGQSQQCGCNRASSAPSALALEKLLGKRISICSLHPDTGQHGLEKAVVATSSACLTAVDSEALGEGKYWHTAGPPTPPLTLPTVNLAMEIGVSSLTFITPWGGKSSEGLGQGCFSKQTSQARVFGECLLFSCSSCEDWVRKECRFLFFKSLFYFPIAVDMQYYISSGVQYSD